MAVQLPVGRDDDERRAATGIERPAQVRCDPLAREPVGVGRCLRLERDRRRQAGVIERDHDAPAAAELDAVGTPRVEIRSGCLPRREDRVAQPLLGGDPQAGDVDRGLGEPQALGVAPEAEQEVAQPPADLGAPVGRRGECRDRVVERLRHPVAARDGDRHVTVSGPVAIDEPAIRLRVASLEPFGERRAEVPRHPAVVAPLGVRAVALRGHARVPVLERRGRGVRRHRAAERVDAQRLVEVAMNDEAAAAHATSSSARSRAVLTACSTRKAWRCPGPSVSGQESNSALPW